MPTRKTRKKGNAQTAQIRQGGNPGKPDNYDGAANTRAETPSPVKPDYEGPGKVIKT